MPVPRPAPTATLLMALPMALLMALFASIGAPAACAQDAPAPAALVRSWLRHQVEHGADAVRFTFDERSELTTDGPFGTRRIRQEVRVTGGAGDAPWDRTFVALSVNDRPVGPGRWGEPGRRRHGVESPPMERIMRESHLGPRLFERMRTTGTAARDAVGSADAWRVEFLPRDPAAPAERLTLWFDRTGARLLRARMLLRRERGEAPLQVTTDYTRIDGLDVPRARHIEGTLQLRRRMRTFTVLFSYRGEYDHYRFFAD